MAVEFPQNTMRKGRYTVHQEYFTPDQGEELYQTWKQLAVELLTEHHERQVHYPPKVLHPRPGGGAGPDMETDGSRAPHRTP
jgi:hypothetical protein